MTAGPRLPLCHFVVRAVQCNLARTDATSATTREGRRTGEVCDTCCLFHEAHCAPPRPLLSSFNPSLLSLRPPLPRTRRCLPNRTTPAREGRSPHPYRGCKTPSCSYCASSLLPLASLSLRKQSEHKQGLRRGMKGEGQQMELHVRSRHEHEFVHVDCSSCSFRRIICRVLQHPRLPPLPLPLPRRALAQAQQPILLHNTLLPQSRSQHAACCSTCARERLGWRRPTFAPGRLRHLTLVLLSRKRPPPLPQAARSAKQLSWNRPTPMLR
jgi:hypothetical protein